MLSRIFAITINTYREALRDRVLIGLLGFACVCMLFTLALAELSLNEQVRVVRDLGLAVASLASVLTAIVLGASLLYKEIERKTLYLILPKPISRTEFLLGKYFGIGLTGLVFLACMTALQCIVASLQQGASHTTALLFIALALGVLGLLVWWKKEGSMPTLIWSVGAAVTALLFARAHQVEVHTLIAAILLIAGEFFVVTAVAIFFSSFSTPFTTGILTLGLWILGRSADTMVSIKSKMVGASLKSLLKVIARVVPNFNLFVPGHYALSGASKYWAGLGTYLLSTLGYALAYSACLLVLASWIFRKRDFT